MSTERIPQLLLFCYRLCAADVMNQDLKYIYPISRVGSIDRLLRVTAHNAFLVVSPLAAASDDATNSVGLSKQSPLLYERHSIHPVHRTKLIEQRRRQEALKRKQYTAINDDEESRGATPVASSGGDEGSSSEVALVFHGLILRSQLVELLRNRIFFDENLGVRDCVVIKCNCTVPAGGGTACY